MFDTYRLSGRFSLSHLLALPPLAAAVGGAAGLYQWALHICQWPWLNAILAGGFCGAMAWMCGAVVGLLKCRNGALAYGVAAVLASIALGAGHLVEYLLQSLTLNRSLGFEEYLDVRLRLGWGAPLPNGLAPLAVKGPGVWAVWVLEAFLVVIGSAAGAAARLRRPFCEECERWTLCPGGLMDVLLEREPFERVVNADWAAELVRRILDLQAFASHRAVVPAGSIITRLESCPTCETSNYVTVTVVKLAGNRREVSTRHNRVRVSREDARGLRERLAAAKHLRHDQPKRLGE